MQVVVLFIRAEQAGDLQVKTADKHFVSLSRTLIFLCFCYYLLLLFNISDFCLLCPFQPLKYDTYKNRKG